MSENRRRTPRIKAEHDLVVRGSAEGEGNKLDARSVDLNLGGIYCTVGNHLELFSKVELDISLPVKGPDGSVCPVDLQLAGVIVRIEPEEAEEDRDSYDVAIAFLNLPPETELLLAKYMLEQMAAE